MRLYTNKMSDNTKQVRVDNWGIFFLQRLQMFFSKTDYCDMTLQFDGNVQLKVHRLVMNACTEYFQYLEQTCMVEDNVIMMPPHLQADVIVPIVNFMYTGMLEFHLSTFEKLYRTAQTMNITILTKLLDAQKQPLSTKLPKKKIIKPTQTLNTSVEKKFTVKPAQHLDLPATLPGRKLPVWKRKTIPHSTPQPSRSTTSIYQESPWKSTNESLLLADNIPKPTRFEWPDEELPAISLIETSFENISYTSKPLLTQEEEIRASTSFDEAKQNIHTPSPTKKHQQSSINNLDIEEMKSYVQEQKIRSGLHNEEELIDNDLDDYNSNDSLSVGIKRKLEKSSKSGVMQKRVRFDDSDSKPRTISIATDKKMGSDLNHSQIVTEILKKYPQLVKKNKNIRLKIMAKNKVATVSVESSSKTSKPQAQPIESPKVEARIQNKTKDINKINDNGPWICDRCSTPDEPVEFVLYYLYRKHMTDVHNEKFDTKSCKYCGRHCPKTTILMYHMYTKHGMKPTSNYNFPKCSQCPFIALSQTILNKHKLRHSANEGQCPDCKLAFNSQAALTSHIQITGHTGKTNKNNFDCQYCTKRFQSGINLFVHVRVQHRNEAIRDGFVSIDETDDIDEEMDESSSAINDEYILPEIITETSPVRKKVNVISNVKIDSEKIQNQQQNTQQQQEQHLTLEPSSEAEALNNVASGIATSLGLVDIVVLNDNQQLFLQSDHHQSNFGSQQHHHHHQEEYVLPEISHDDTFQVQNQHDQVITTDGVITQSMLSSGDIASTDELVMVLTDHDYGDNQEEINNDNSNIVVLYSHPVDGQQNHQYITSEGNIMVNSQTGMIEIRNGATITSTANQVVMNPQDAHIESIEMIQREIEGHSTSELKPVQEFVAHTEETIDKSQFDQNSELVNVMESSENIENVLPPLPDSSSHEVESEQIKDEQQPPLEAEKLIENNVELMDTDEPISCNISNEENVAELINTVSISEKSDSVSETIETPPPNESMKQIEETPAKETMKEETHAAPPITSDNVTTQENTEIKNEQTCQLEVDEQPTPTVQSQDDSAQDRQPHVSVAETPQLIEDSTQKEEVEMQNDQLEAVVDTPAESDIVDAGDKPTEEAPKEDHMKIVEDESSQGLEEEAEKKDLESKEVTEEEEEEEKSFDQHSQQLTTDEASQSSQESQEEEHTVGTETNEDHSATKISILDDWEDTDSQQSEQKNRKLAEETVGKLMDDWEEEDDEEDSKKGANTNE